VEFRLFLHNLQLCYSCCGGSRISIQVVSNVFPRWIGPFVVSNIFPYGAVEITSLETNKVLKVNGHRLKPFYEGWTVELTASMELAEPIYEE